MASFGRTRRAQPSFIRPFAILIALSLVLLLSRNSEPVRAIATGATGLLVPIQRVLADIGVTTNRFVQAITEIERLRADNAALRNDVDRLTLENVQLREAAFAAQQAAKLNEVAKGLKFETVAAPVIARDPSNVLATIVLGAGTDSGIKVGHVVVSEQGLVGRVSEVGPNYSKVLLITDPSSTLSALVEGSRATGIVHGQYGDSLIIDWILGAAPNPGAASGGVAFGVRILPIKVLDCAGTGSNPDIAAGIVWAVDHGARIVNVSLGSPVESDVLEEAIRYAEARDVLVVAAAGNCGAGGGRCRRVNSQESPAALPGVLAVGATDPDDKVTPFSTRGSQIAVVAPGVKITSTTPRYATYQSARGITPNYAALSGTSQASAFVAGVAALIWSAEPTLSATDVADRITAYADDVGLPGRDDESGAGRVNALRALRHPARVSSGRVDTVVASALKRNVGIGASEVDRPRVMRTLMPIDLVEDAAIAR